MIMTVKSRTAPGKTRMKRIIIYIVIIFLFWLTTIAYLSADNIIKAKGDEIELIKKDVTDLKAENERLRLRIAELTTPQYIEKTAAEELGMVAADSDDKVYYLP